VQGKCKCNAELSSKALSTGREEFHVDIHAQKTHKKEQKEDPSPEYGDVECEVNSELDTFSWKGNPRQRQVNSSGMQASRRSGNWDGFMCGLESLDLSFNSGSVGLGSLKRIRSEV